MEPDFDVEELEKLPPAQRLAKIKELKQKLQTKIEQEAGKLEEDSKRDLAEEQRQIDELLHLRVEEEENQQESKSQLEETVKKTPVEEEKNNQVDYSKPPTSEYVAPESQGQNADPFTKEIGPKKLEKDSIYDSSKDYI